MSDVYVGKTTGPVTLDLNAEKIVLLELTVRPGDYVDVTAAVSLMWTYLGPPNVLVEPGAYSAEVGLMSVTLSGSAPSATIGGFGLPTVSVPRGERIRLVLHLTSNPRGEPWKVVANATFRATGPVKP